MKIDGICLVEVLDRDIDENGVFTIPEGITSIGAFAFNNNPKLKKINNTDQLVEINSDAFLSCENLSEFTFGPNLRYISITGIFTGCKNLNKIEVNPENLYYTSIDGCVYTKDKKRLIAIPSNIEVMNIPEGTETINYHLFASAERLKELNLPSTIRATDIIEYNDNTPMSVQVLSLDSLERINVSQNHQSLSTIDGVLYSKDRKTLYFCPPKRKKLDLPEGTVYALGDAISYNSDIEEIYLPSTFERIEAYAARENRVLSYGLKKFEVSKDNRRFSSINGMLGSKDGRVIYQIPENIDVETLEIPEGVETLDVDNLGGINVKTIIFPDTLRTIEMPDYGVKTENLEKILISPANGTFSFKDGVLYDIEENAIVLCTKAAKEITFTKDLKVQVKCGLLLNATGLEKINVEEGTNFDTEIFDNSCDLENLKEINAPGYIQNEIYECLAEHYKGKQALGETMISMNRIIPKKVFVAMLNDPELDNNILVFLYRMINTIGPEEAESFFNLPNPSAEEIRQALDENNREYINLYNTKFQVRGNFGVTLEFLKLINEYSSRNNKGAKNSLEISILSAINESIEKGEYNTVYDVLNAKFPDINNEFLETIKQRETKINKRLMVKNLESMEEYITKAISQIGDNHIIVERQQKPVFLKVVKSIKKSFENKNCIDIEDIQKTLEKEFENSSPYIRQNANCIIANVVNLFNDENFKKSISKNTLDAIAEVKSSIGDKWRYKLELKLRDMGYSISSFPNLLTAEEIAQLEEKLNLPNPIETLPIAELKDKDRVREAYEFLTDIGHPGLLAGYQLHDMFGSVSYPYSEEFKQYFKQHKEEFISNPEMFYKFGFIQRNFDRIVHEPELRNIYEKGKLTVDQILSFYNNMELSLKKGDEELAQYCKTFGVIGENELAFAQEIFNIVRQRQRSTVPPMNVQKGKYRGRMLSPDDILNMFAGDITTCCQRFNDVGEASMVLGSIEENAGIFVVEELDKNGNSLGIVGQSLTYRQKGTTGHYDRLTFDNIEIAKPAYNKLTPEDNDAILEIYKDAAKQAFEMDKKFLGELLHDGQINKTQYDSLVLKEAILGTAYTKLKGLDQFETAEIVVLEEGDKRYKSAKFKNYPWLDSTDGESSRGGSGKPVILLRNEEQAGEETQLKTADTVPLWYGKSGKVVTKKDDEITEEDINVIRRIEKATCKEDRKLMSFVESEEELKQIYNIENPVIKIGSNNDWYMIYNEVGNAITISDICVYGALNAERNTKIKGNNNRLAIAESAYEVYKLLIEAQKEGKEVYCDASEEIPYRILTNMAKRSLIGPNSQQEENLKHLKIEPRLENLEEEIGKVERFLFDAQSLYRMKGVKKEKDIDKLRSDIR